MFVFNMFKEALDRASGGERVEAKANAIELKMIRLTKEVADYQYNSNWAYSYVSKGEEDGAEHVSVQEASACHARLSYLSNNEQVCTSIIGLIHPLKLPDHADKTQKNMTAYLRTEYMHWLLNDSPYAPAFKVKDASWSINNGVVCDVTCPANLLVGGLIASRRLWEYTPVVWVMYRLIKRGVPPNLAYLLGHCATVKQSSYKPRTVTSVKWNQTLAGHRTPSVNTISMRGVKEFVTCSPDESRLLPPYNKHNDYRRVDAVWDDDYGKSLSSYVSARYKYEHEGVESIGWEEVKVKRDSSPSKSLDQMAMLAKKIMKEMKI